MEGRGGTINWGRPRRWRLARLDSFLSAQFGSVRLDLACASSSRLLVLGSTWLAPARLGLMCVSARLDRLSSTWQGSACLRLACLCPTLLSRSGSVHLGLALSGLFRSEESGASGASGGSMVKARAWANWRDNFFGGQSVLAARFFRGAWRDNYLGGLRSPRQILTLRVPPRGGYK